MGVSFKVSKIGARFHPKPLQSEASVDDAAENFNSETPRVVRVNDTSSANIIRKPEVGGIEAVLDVAGNSGSSISSRGLLNTAGAEVSFTLNLFPDGYSIKKLSEIEAAYQISLQDASKFLRPYDRLSESLFSAIECGRLPGDILNDIPCKFIDGKLMCEVRDYRNCIAESSGSAQSTGMPIVNKVCLGMSLENVVKDIPLISDSSWTYGDLMLLEVESRILNALQPKLCLDPIPKLDRLCVSSNFGKLNLDSSSLRKKRLREMSEVTVTSSKTMQGKKVCIDRVPGSSNSVPLSSDAMSHLVHETTTAENIRSRSMSTGRQQSVGPAGSVSPLMSPSNQARFHGSGGSVINALGPPSAGQDNMPSYAGDVNTSTSLLHGNRENHEGQLSPNKKARLALHMDGLNGSDFNWKNANGQQPLITRGFQYTSPGLPKYSHQRLEGVLNQDAGTGLNSMGQQGLRFGAKEEPVEMEKLDRPELSCSKNDLPVLEAEMNLFDPPQSRLQPKLPQQAFARSNFSWNSLNQPIEKDLRREEQVQKRKLVQSPRVSAGASVQSPLSSKSGDFPNGSFGQQFGAAVNNNVLGLPHKEKAAVTSVYSGTASLNSTVNESFQRQQAQIAAKRKSNSLPKITVASGVGSPASVGNVCVPLISSSPPVGTPSVPDQAVLDRFYKLEAVAMRNQLHRKKNKVDDHHMRKPPTYCDNQLKHLLSLVSNVEDINDDAATRSLSHSVVGGSANTCKMRVLNLILQERIIQGNQFVLIPKDRAKLIMSEKLNDGTVALYWGEIEEDEFLTAEEYLPTLPNTHFADLFAAQLSSLMIRDGYVVEKDTVQPKPTGLNPPCGQANPSGIPPNNPEQYAEPCNEMVKPNVLANTRTLPPGNTQSLQMSQGLLPGISMPPRSQHLDPQSSFQPLPPPQPQLQQQQQNQNQPSMIQQLHPQFQRSANPFPHLNASMPLGSMMYKPGSLPLQLMQSQQPQQQRKMMMNMGNMSNNLVALGGLTNAMGMGAARGIGGAGLTAPMGQNPLNLSQASSLGTMGQHPRMFSQAHAALLNPRLKMVQNQAAPSALAGMPGGSRYLNASSGGLAALGQAMGRANMGTVPRSAIGPMGPPKSAGMSLYMNQQLQQHLQQQQQHLQQQQPQQEEMASASLQAVISPSQVGSPSTMNLSQQQASPQMLSQRTAMSPGLQMSGGTVHPLSTGNPEACPASPQLSSQTLGSVGSISNSPMELQGVNKSNSMSNT